MIGRPVRIATANVLVRLGETLAGRALDLVLELRPEVVGLQEWSRRRRRLLKQRGRLWRVPALHRRRHPTSGYVFGYPLLGGQPVGVDAAKRELLSVRRVKGSRRRRGVRVTWHTEALTRVRATGQLEPVLNLHLLAHHNDPAHRKGWEEGRESAEAWVESWHGYRRWVMGDTNRHLMGLPPLVSCWHTNGVDGTFGRRAIDNIYGELPAEDATALDTPSDHDAVVADYLEPINERNHP